MRKPSALVLALLIVPVAGCIVGKAPNVKDTAADALNLVPIPAFPIEQDHDHSLPGEHDASANLMAVSFNSGYGDGTTDALPAGQGFSELFVRDGLAFLGRRGGDDGGFVIFDVKDPTMPKRLSAYQGLADYDMESTADNQFVFFVSQFAPTQQTAAVPPRAVGDVPRGIHVIDIKDPTKPTEAFFFPVPTRGAHTITYYRTDAGRELVAAQTYDFIPDPSLALPVPDQGVNPVAERVLLFDFVRSPAPHLELLSTYEKHEMPALNEFFPHDVAIQKHPITGQLLMYVAYWNLGAFLVDISDPKNPKDIAHLDDFSPSKVVSVHLAAPADTLIDGRHITVTEPEMGPVDETGQYTVFDTTDPAHPQRLGFWTLPGHLQNTVGLRFSPHNFEIENGRMYLAHYHAGVWVVDLHDAAHLAQPEALAFVQPHVARKAYAGDAPNVWTALYDHGTIYASDIATGLYAYHYAGDPMPAMDEHAHMHMH